MKVLISDNLGEAGISLLREEEGFEVDIKTGLTPDELIDIIGNYDALAVRSATKVTAELLDAATNLKVIGRAGIGVDNINVPEATKRGIVVMNTPGGNVVTTGEHAVAMMMSLTRNIPQATASLKAGRWEKKLLQGKEIYNKILGVIGFGKIGSVVASRALGLKMRVIVHDPVIPAEKIEKLGYEAVSLEKLYRTSDYITVHVPKTKNTTGLLNKQAFDQMKDGVMIINCARGGIVDESDLYDAIVSGKVAGAALDVFQTEPPGDSPLLALDKVIATPHLGASTEEAQTNVSIAVAQQIIAYLKDNTIINPINVPSVTGEVLAKLQPYLTMADRIGCLQAQLISGQLKEVAIEYNGDYYGFDLGPVTTALLNGLLTPLVPEEVNSVNAPVLAQNMGIRIVETSSGDSFDYLNLMNVKIKTTDMTSTVAGTVFGKNSPRIVRINDIPLEIIPEGHFTLIHEHDVPGAIGAIGTLLGEHSINIDRMITSQGVEADNFVVFIRTDSVLSESVLEELRSLSMVKAVTPLEL